MLSSESDWVYVHVLIVLLVLFVIVDFFITLILFLGYLDNYYCQPWKHDSNYTVNIIIATILCDL